jgi:hypothetical protein
MNRVLTNLERNKQKLAKKKEDAKKKRVIKPNRNK